ncbi:hypothetical protein [Nocardioides zeae]|uniref:Glycosyltransferase RgtA/B/C/D-like domain-containing protein n=1 Tax=Nocardioides zeae TaxID=1457234 RepID=A0AAJ1U2S1_9ACTN|nr:hypothetical protein [Nocardioides zeae]MDQ1103466.1 hypothetical protein [Nocardioides zeae]
MNAARGLGDTSVNARRTTLVVVALALLGVALRLPFLGVPPGPDESGFFIIGQQWRDGTSLYGDYWVDRPPLLVTIFWLVPSITGLRIVGCLAVAAVVLLVGLAAYAARGHRAAVAAAATAALLSAAPWLGVVRVNGELLASPFVAGAMVLTVLMLRDSARRPHLLALGAGAASAAAFGVKQSSVDGFVFGTVALAVLALTRRERRTQALTLLLAAAGGALAFAALLVAWGATRGTDPVGLFHAVVTFRADAGEVIRESASSATTDRLREMVLAWLVSGLSLLTVVALALGVRHRRDPVVVATLATLLAGSAVALLGGSYWLHYLAQLIPAAALTTAWLVGGPGDGSGDGSGAAPETDRGPGRTRRLAVLLVAVWLPVATVVTLSDELSHPIDDGPAEATGAFIREASAPGDTIVVAYGQPNVVLDSGLTAPYEHLWSLPIRVLDPDLADLTALVESPERPTWVVQWGRDGFATWAVRTDAFSEAVHEHYREAATVCGRTVWLRDDADRSLPAPEAC